MGHPPVASPTPADQAASLSDAPQALFAAPWETLVHLSPAISCEQDPTSFETCSRELPLGVPLHAAPPTSVLRQCIQMLHHLDTELDFVVGFCLPSPAAST